MPSAEKIKWSIGCSGFHYDDWKGSFYPEHLPKKKWFAFYCEHFNSLELNVTFYRFPQLKFLQNWHQNSPRDFVFSVKVPRLITHYKQFNETKRMLDDFYGLCKTGLGEKLGCVLFQLPSRLQFSEKLIETITEQLNGTFINVIEFRHASWWNKKVYTLLKLHNVIFCGHSYPLLPQEVVVNSPIVYFRFHGVPVVYFSQYKRRFLEEVATKIQTTSKVEQAFLYFNNTATMAAVRNAFYLQKLVGQKIQHLVN